MAPPGANAAAMSAFRALADFGYVAGPLLLGLVADWFGANVALAGTAALLVVVASLFARLAPETHAGRRRGEATRQPGGGEGRPLVQGRPADAAPRDR